MNMAFIPGFLWFSSSRKCIYMDIPEAVFKMLKTFKNEKEKSKTLSPPPKNDGYIVTTVG